jgi:hypothetical protein
MVMSCFVRQPPPNSPAVGSRSAHVARTFVWIVKNRRFARDDAQLTGVAETLIDIAANVTLIRRRP